MSTKEQRKRSPIFVVGYMHSGTTLLHNILAAHPDVFAAQDETRFFAYLPMIRTLYPDLTNEVVLSNLMAMLADLIKNGDPARLRTLPKHYRPNSPILTEVDFAKMISAAHEHHDHANIFRIVFDNLTQQTGSLRWIEKTPQHVFLIDEILCAVPNALFVEIIRDPRDILASKKKRKTMQATTNLTPEEHRVKSLERVYDPFWEALEWRLALRAGQISHEKHSDRFYSLRYEDLVTDPEVVVRQLCDFLELTFWHDMLNVQWWNTAEGNRQDRSGIVSDSIGRWKRNLGEGELALCQWVVGNQFTRVGYAPATTSWTGRLSIPWLVFRAGFGLLDRLIRRWRLGGWAFLLNTLKNYSKEIRKLSR